jgi:eukaryotic-like serine/threonine-protein kinase
MASLGEVEIQQEKYALAEPLVCEALGNWETASPGSWKRYYGQALVGASLTGQKRFAEAEPLLLAGYQGLQERQTSIPAGTRRVVSEAGLRIAQLYRDWGQPEKAREWEEKVRGK